VILCFPTCWSTNKSWTCKPRSMFQWPQILGKSIPMYFLDTILPNHPKQSLKELHLGPKGYSSISYCELQWRPLCALCWNLLNPARAIALPTRTLILRSSRTRWGMCGLSKRSCLNTSSIIMGSILIKVPFTFLHAFNGKFWKENFVLQKLWTLKSQFMFRGTVKQVFPCGCVSTTLLCSKSF